MVFEWTLSKGPFTQGFQLASGCTLFESTSRGGLNPDSFKSYATRSELKSLCERSLVLAYSKIDLSLLQRQSASQQKHGSMGDSTFSSISPLGILGPGDSRLCMRLALHVHYRPFSVTFEESLRDSEPPLNGYPSTKGQETS